MSGFTCAARSRRLSTSSLYTWTASISILPMVKKQETNRKLGWRVVVATRQEESRKIGNGEFAARRSEQAKKRFRNWTRRLRKPTPVLAEAWVEQRTGPLQFFLHLGFVNPGEAPIFITRVVAKLSIYPFNLSLPNDYLKVDDQSGRNGQKWSHPTLGNGATLGRGSGSLEVSTGFRRKDAENG